MSNSSKDADSSLKSTVKPRYLILGSGSIGFALAKELRESNKLVIIVDKDEAKVETLREEGFETILGDISDPELINNIDLKNVVAILFLSSNNEANRKGIENFKKVLNPDIQIFSRSSDIINKEKMEDLGADYVFMPSKLVASSLSRSLERAESVHRGNRLARWLKGIRDKKLAIVIHDNPDPDAISSGLALKEIATSLGVEANILYHGKIGHQENKAFVNLLGIDLSKMEEHDLKNFDEIALIDCSIPGVNNMVPLNSYVGIVIDHHPPGETEIKADYIDIRPNFGATATIMTKYLQQLNINISKTLATALLYGIRTDTQDFKRKTDPADLSAASYLYPLSNHGILDQLEQPSMATETLEVLGEAIRNRQVIGSYLLSNVGNIRDRDTLPQAADYLLSLEGISTTIVFGVTEDRIYISGRSTDIRVNLGEIMRQAFGEDAGGHANAAGAQIPLGVFSATKDRQTLLRLVNEAVVKRFLNAVGVESTAE
ncbi:Kef-type K+ transport systems (NAD-binding component fused to domain related to exopolyphosphatase) [Methanosarcina siciliae C2J]|uniref:Kef-type K+ transport systems (NAD-binding component fused to domain related to exopolyphosphatase) n=3 Tax=Methanosarcina siciliae TaxID=38027 RepID=A0A0E3PFL3_9EURY|nr:DHH family phosphoesterase [Methanosarcina siciliae]AKB29601.1 Kef-type K+ transport systems (NAD-binding component fused to domain related to exopolyphosphatase) [Methanosarcina siciliae T4/M]AKB33537.1 Kef-type K+ transport systems (NAD-binding component fused to domain related to exopolyphosphatase) [Methanosarcina siciliae HI350]AKB35855.1 Kef-type K+ transport systems (NAD-binding component fused to domain related to exopolyphosphatase) [Methanosarcina siciliae C2J]